MYKRIASIMMVMCLLAGCSSPKEKLKSQEQTQSQSQEQTQSQVIASQQQVNSIKDEASTLKEKYRQLLEEARDKQEEYIQSLPENERGSVQTALSAMQAYAIQLQQQNPNDKGLIEEVLAQLFQLTGEDTTEMGTKSLASIQEIIQKYEERTGGKFLEATPASIRNYYHLATPDQTLSNAYLNNGQIAFAVTDEYHLGDGDLYILQGCYVSETGRELILFVEKDQQKLVLQSTSEPMENKVNLTIATDEILNEYIK